MKLVKRITTFLMVCGIIIGTISQIPVIYGQRVEVHQICSELDASYNPVSFKHEFDRDDQWVISWVRLRSISKGFTVTWEWRDPDKNIYKEVTEEISGEKNTQKVNNQLNLEEQIFENPGFWTVLFYVNDKYQFTDHFTITDEKKETTPTVTTIQSLTTSMETSEVLQSPHLVLQDIITSPPEDTPIYPGDPFSITYIIENAGEAPAQNVVMKVLDIPREVMSLRSTVTKDIPVGQTAEFTVEFKALDSGYFELTREIVLDGEVLDIASITVTVSSLDVNVKVGGVETIPEEGEAVKPGDYVTFTVQLENTGTTPAKKVELKPSHIPEGIQLVDLTSPIDIKAEETKEFTLKFLCEKEGAYEIPIDLIVMGKTLDSTHFEIIVTEPLTLNWTLLIGLIVVIAVIVAIVYFKKKGFPSRRKEVPQRVETRFCIHCGTEIDEEDQFCGNCGKSQ